MEVPWQRYNIADDVGFHDDIFYSGPSRHADKNKYGGKRRGIQVLVPFEVLPPIFHFIAHGDEKERNTPKGITVEILSKFRKQVKILRIRLLTFEFARFCVGRVL